jgi:hypothetical protein
MVNEARVVTETDTWGLGGWLIFRTKAFVLFSPGHNNPIDPGRFPPKSKWRLIRARLEAENCIRERCIRSQLRGHEGCSSVMVRGWEVGQQPANYNTFRR